MLDDTSLQVTCVAGPTLPREPVASQLHSRNETTQGAAIAWRLINMLTLNYLGTTARAAGNQAEAVREMLSMFADASDSVIERRIRAVRRVDSSPLCDVFANGSSTGTARGQEIKVTVDEKGFEGSGAFLLGAVMERFPLPTIRASIISRRLSSFQTSAAKSCVGRRAWERVGHNDLD